MEKVVIVTGANRGLGKALAVALLQAGFKVVGTVRQQDAAEPFEQLKPGAAFARVLDVTDAPERLASVIEGVEQKVGPIYALINNAGYGHEGTLEESSMDELRRQFEVNVFGAVAMMKAVLPSMRARREGRILNVTSMGGLMTMPGLPFYHGSKFALEGISSSLAKEVRPLGIYVTAVEPGMFRTDWAGRSMVRSVRTIADYDSIFDPVREARKARNGRQPGDPAKAGRMIADFLTAPDPPLHLLLGPDAFDFVQKEIETLRAEFSKWEPVTRSTNFDEAAQNAAAAASNRSHSMSSTQVLETNAGSLLPLADDPTMATVLTDAAGAFPPINVFRALANAPSLAPDYIRYFVHLFKQLELDARTERLIVLLIGKLSGCKYIWRQNVVVARILGISDEEIEELHKGNLEARCFSQARRAAFRFAKEALERIEVTDATYAEAAVHFSSRALLEILYVIGSYMFLARVIRTGRIPLDETPAEVPNKVFDWFSNRPALRRADEVAARSEYE